MSIFIMYLAPSSAYNFSFAGIDIINDFKRYIMFAWPHKKWSLLKIKNGFDLHTTKNSLHFRKV